MLEFSKGDPLMTQPLAIDGGTPVRTTPWPAWPMSDEREERLILEVLHSGKWSALHGDKVKTFQERFAAYQGAEHAVCVPNGTLALQVALMALGIQPGDEVIVPAYTFIATISTALVMGARPVFVDIDPDSYNLDVRQIAAAITPKTRAILPVHLAGRPADLDGILPLAREHNLAVLEDACQAWGAEWRGQRVGALGNLGAFSFQNGKNITSGEGGAVVTNDPALYEQVWSLHNVGRTFSGEWYHHENLGLNLRMTEWQGAILLAQLERLEEHYPIRERNARYLSAELSRLGGLSPLPGDPRVTRDARHLLLLRYDPQAFGGRARQTSWLPWLPRASPRSAPVTSACRMPRQSVRPCRPVLGLTAPVSTCRAPNRPPARPCGSLKMRCWAASRNWMTS
jgi:dTDP-4-amino-4,6-dideoxygalactose transaminase